MTLDLPPKSTLSCTVDQNPSESDLTQKVTHEYCGTSDENELRHGTGCQVWTKDDFLQKYTGHFLYNNLHEYGVCLIEDGPNRTYYDGLFYANKLEGYGRIIYSNGSSFEGLFKKHYRYGPGIVTNLDGRQDIGLWNHTSLVRLALVVDPECIPRLGTTVKGKNYLVKYKNFVPVCEKGKNEAEELLKSLGANERVLARAQELYNPNCRHPNSLFFNKSLYDDSFFSKEDCTIEVELTKEEYEEELRDMSEQSQKSFGEKSRDEDQIEGEDVELMFGSCTCLALKRDKFTQICVHLNKIELKLYEILTAIDELKHKLHHCKYCCEMRRLEALKKSIKEEDSVPNLVMEQKVNDAAVEEHEEVPNTNEEIHQHSFSIDKTDTELNNFDININNVSQATLPFGGSQMFQLSHSVEFSKTSLESVHGEQSNRDPRLDHSKLFNELVGEASNLGLIPEVCICGRFDIEFKQNQGTLRDLQDEERFYSTIKNCLKLRLDEEYRRINKLSEPSERYYKKVVVSDLIAWNNEERSMKMLQHCFRHRNSEDNVNFEVAQLLAGNRKRFQSPGDYETACIRFLEKCSQGQVRNAFELLQNNFLDPDLADARGNTGIMFAAAHDRIGTITILVKCGCKLDICNDEGLTPLLLSLLRFLSYKFKVSEWESAFLKTSTVLAENVGNQSWRPHESFLDALNTTDWDDEKGRSSSKGVSLAFSNEVVTSASKVLEVKEKLAEFEKKPSLDNLTTAPNQEYILDTDYKRIPKPPPEPTPKTDKKGKQGKKKSKKSKSIEASETSNKAKKVEEEVVEKTKDSSREEYIAQKLDLIKKTIMTLLSYKADPNIGIVPKPGLILAVFSGEAELVRVLLENRANPNVVTLEENLTSLHVLGSLKPSKEHLAILEILLEFRADPNLRTSAEHWPEIKQELLGQGINEIDVLDEGKNVLQLLCAREDFPKDSEGWLRKMAQVLVKNGCENGDFYLGHTALSLAVLRGNLEMITDLIETHLVDPHQVLGNGMGNILTVMVLNRFSNALSYDKNKEMIDLLIKFCVNPLRSIGDFENAIHVIDDENLLHTEEIKSSERADGKSKKARKEKKKGKKKEQGGGAVNLAAETLMKTEKYLREATRKFLFRNIHSNAVGYLYIFINGNLYDDPLIINLAKLVNLQETSNCLKLIFQNGLLKSDLFRPEMIKELLEFIETTQNLSGNDENIKVNPTEFMLRPKLKNKFPLIQPEIDRDTNTYKVCFECLRRKPLYRCSKCELIHFCSLHCYITNKKTCDLHPCTLTEENFKEEYHGKLLKLLCLAEKVREARIVIKQLTDLEAKLATLKFKSKLLKQKSDKLKAKAIHLIHERQVDTKHQHLLQYEKTKMDLTPYLKDELENLRKVKPSEVLHVSKSIHFLVKSSQPTVELTPFSPEWRQSIQLHSNAPIIITEKTKKLEKKIIKDEPDSRDEKKSERSVKIDTERSKGGGKTEKRRSGQETHPEHPTAKSKPYGPDAGPEMQKSEKSGKVRFSKDYCVNVLIKAFEEFNLPLLLLPYCAYKNGQMYYSLASKPHFGQMFSKLPFSKSTD